MRLHYKAAQISLFGNGREIYLASITPNNRIMITDSHAVVFLNWGDGVGKQTYYPIDYSGGFSAVADKLRFSQITKKRPENGFFKLVVHDDQLLILDLAKYLRTNSVNDSLIGNISYKWVNPNKFNRCYSGLYVKQDILTGSVCVDFDNFCRITDFFKSYLSSGKFETSDIRVVNVQVVNETYPLLIQAYVKCTEEMLLDVDICFFNFPTPEKNWKDQIE